MPPFAKNATKMRHFQAKISKIFWGGGYTQTPPTLGRGIPPYERIKFGYLLENVRFLLLSSNLAREWLPIDTDLLLIITTTADELSGGTNIDDLERP